MLYKRAATAPQAPHKCPNVTYSMVEMFLESVTSLDDCIQIYTIENQHRGDVW